MDPTQPNTGCSAPSMHARRLSSARKRLSSDLAPIHEEMGDNPDLEIQSAHHNSRSITVLPSAFMAKKMATIAHKSHRHTVSLPERSALILKLTMATKARRAAPEPSSTISTQSATSAATPPETNRIRTLGDADCLACTSRPTHTLIPCQHSVCYDHQLLGFNQDRPSSSFCARCDQRVLQVAELKTSSPAATYISSTLSPNNSIWSNESSPSNSESASKMIPPAYRQPWGHPEFVSQTPVQGQRNAIFPPPFAPQQFPIQQFPGQQFPGQQFPNQQFPVQQLPAQQFPQYQRQPQQQAPQQFPPAHYPIQPAAPYPVQPIAHYPTQPASHYPVQPIAHYPNQPTAQLSAQPSGAYVYGGQFAGNAHMVHANPLPFAQDGRRQANRNSGPIVQPQPLSDPFVDDSSSSSATDYSEDPKAVASRLAQQIKQGLFDDPDHGEYYLKRRNSHFNQQNGELQLQQQVQPPEPYQSLARQMLIAPKLIPDPSFFDKLHQGYRPSLNEVFDNVPFTETYKSSKPCHWGVVRISNIPYGTTKNEIIAVLGRHARLVSQPAGMPFYAVHIIMERSTGKTMDCFAELQTEADATSTVEVFQQRCSAGRAPKLGDRNIGVTISSQEELMKELFPRARCVKWEGNLPNVYETTEPFNSGFSGFLTGEEMVMCQKHAEVPQRSPFAQRCHNRTYESLISTLYKYPWFAQDNVTLGERTLLFNTIIACLRALTLAIGRNLNPVVLNPLLLQEVLTAALTNPGFNPKQKSVFCEVVQNAGFNDVISSVPFVYLGAISAFWPFEVLDKKPEASFRALEYYVTLLREGSSSPNDHHQMTLYGANAAPNPFGNVVVDYGDKKSSLSLKKAAILEWNCIESIIGNFVSPSEAQAQIEGQGESQNQDKAHDEMQDQKIQTQIFPVTSNGSQ